MKRFWKEASVARDDGGWLVRLDGRPLRTPRKRPLRLPTRPLAEAVAAEWDAQGAEVDPRALPLTRAGNAAIDRVAEQRAAVVDAIAAYGGSDLLCYRAPHPPALQARQAELWDPILDWARQAFDAPLLTAAGVMHVAQPEASVAALRAEVARHQAWSLTALDALVTLSGSLLLGLAVDRGRLAPDEAWRLSRLEEDWQIAEWGEDAEAAAAVAAKAADFRRAAHLLRLLDDRA